MGITPETWAILWSGIFGSIIGGGVAALIAMLVVRKTNSHQANLTLVQLRAQKDEASKSRENAAIADMLASVEELAQCFFQGSAEIARPSTQMNVALSRWGLEKDNYKHVADARAGAGFLVGLAFDAGSSQGSDRVTTGHRLMLECEKFSVRWSIYPGGGRFG